MPGLVPADSKKLEGIRILCFNPRPAAAFVPTVQITQKGTQTPRLNPSSYRTSVGTTLMLLYGDPLISFVLTTV
jgi:hypothetical protein